jgi:hypothetical protein
MTEPTLFGLLILDRAPFAYSDFWGLLQAWLQDAGGFAAVGLALYLLYALRTPPEQAESAKSRASVSPFMLLMAVLALACYVAYGFLLFTGKGADTANRPTFNPADPMAFVQYHAPKFSWDYQPLALTAGGLFALLGIGQPFAASLTRIRFRRIWALSKLGFKEAVRSRMFWVFLLFLLPFLFPIKWFFPIKPEDELRAIIVFTSFFMAVLLLLSAALLAAFSIPNDIKNQNLYTVITKPVQRFEIVLGRFVGYTFLMTLALLVMTGASLVLISFTNLDEKAREETYKARVPLRGKMEFRSRSETRGEQFTGTNVGREFDYRKYIGGHPSSSQRAVWNFDRVPRSMASGGPVPCEFTFDIFRLTKGEENRGVDISVQVVTWQCPLEPPTDPRDGAWRWKDPERERQYQARAEELIRGTPGLAAQAGRNPAAVLALARAPKPGEAPSPAWTVVDKLAEEFGYYEVRGKEIFDYHPDGIEIPAGLFKNALQGQPKSVDGKTPPLVQVFVKCETPGQMLGMAEGDLYLLEGEQPFALNYLKSAVGLWCRVAIVIGLAVTCSTYLSGVISFLLTVFLFLAGYAAEHLQDLASGHSAVGGPFRSMNQLLRAEGSTVQPDPGSSLAVAADSLDKLFSWGVRRFINLVPDVYAYSWTDFVKEGFNIPLESLLMNLLVTAAYLLPWFILGYFLFRSREVAA